VVLPEEVGVHCRARQQQACACQQDRAEDADDGLHEWGAMEGDPLLGGEGCVHFMMSREKASGPIATSPVKGKSRFTMV